MLNDTRVSLLEFDVLSPVGLIARDGSSFSYDSAYLAAPHAVPLSMSLPLQGRPFSAKEFLPYFEGLLAEGMARQALAAELQISEDDTLGLLTRCGRECIGDVVIGLDDGELPLRSLGYAPVSPYELERLFSGSPNIAEENASSRLSLAGTQNKVGLAHDPRFSMGEGWLRPQGLAATTHILKTSYLRDIPEVEFLCMHAAAACGIRVARTSLLNFGTPVLAIERFDRSALVGDGVLRVKRIHQEDLAQAFGVLPGSKYAELPGGSARSVVELLKRHSLNPARDVQDFCRVLLFSYLIGNCDAHLKNYSIQLFPASRDGRPCIALTAAYDLVSTTCFPRFSRSMAMSFAGERDIDNIDVRTLELLADELGVKRNALRRVALPMVENIVQTINRTAAGEEGAVLDSTPYVADDLVEDIQPRLEVLREFCTC